jgi:hypothetical protein
MPIEEESNKCYSLGYIFKLVVGDGHLSMIMPSKKGLIIVVIEGKGKKGRKIIYQNDIVKNTNLYQIDISGLRTVEFLI